MSSIVGSRIRSIVVACDGGMGSSALLAAQLSRVLSKYSVTVRHAQLNKIPADADVVICQQALVARARAAAPEKVVLGFQFFLGDPLFDRLEQAIKAGEILAG